MSEWKGSATVPFGNFGLFDARGNVSGPVGDKAAVGFAVGYQQRDGYTTNAITGIATARLVPDWDALLRKRDRAQAGRQ
jgi:hypothetical protein